MSDWPVKLSAVLKLREKKATRKSCYLTQTLHQSFFLAFMYFVLSSRKLSQILTKAATAADLYSALKKGHWLPHLVSFKSFQEWSYSTTLPFSQRKIRVDYGYFTFQVF